MHGTSRIFGKTYLLHTSSDASDASAAAVSDASAAAVIQRK